MDSFRWVQSCLPFVVLCVSESRSQKEVCGMQDRGTHWLYTSFGTGWYFNKNKTKTFQQQKAKNDGLLVGHHWMMYDFSAEMPFSRQRTVILNETNEKAWTGRYALWQVSWSLDVVSVCQWSSSSLVRRLCCVLTRVPLSLVFVIVVNNWKCKASELIVFSYAATTVFELNYEQRNIFTYLSRIVVFIWTLKMLYQSTKRNWLANQIIMCCPRQRKREINWLIFYTRGWRF